MVEREGEEGLGTWARRPRPSGRCGDPVAGSRVLDSIGNLLTRQGRVADAEPYLRQSLEIKEDLGDRQGQAITLGNLGRVKRAQGALAEAEALFARDLSIAREPRGRAAASGSR